ncbi:hypothetical protein [Pedobacter antarcticus]|uniref:hypothetical protein n=1 Tax=Pedobacter antarcticus TaxID=34086 RepID=UPI00292D1BA2|nr:hypothetical protein [Pedobacter antarcticus]
MFRQNILEEPLLAGKYLALPALKPLSVMSQERNPYQQFNVQILKDWIGNGVKYIKLVELQSNLPVQFFELIPDSEIPDSEETIYPIDSEEITELLEPLAKVKFLVHEIYLEEEF